MGFTTGSVLLNESYGVGGHSFFAPNEAHPFGSGGFDRDVVFTDTNDGSHACLHGGDVRIDLGLLRTNSSIDVPHAVAFSGDELDGFLQQYFTVYIKRFNRGVGKVITNVAHVGRSKQGVADSVDEHVGIAMA